MIRERERKTYDTTQENADDTQRVADCNVCHHDIAINRE